MNNEIFLPPAKINLGLFVTSRRPDGYHDLETVFHAIPLRDRLEVKEWRSASEPFRLYVSGAPDLCPPEQNLVVRVYMALRDEFCLPDVEIFLRKNIPSGAGLGGGSSDAAAMMLLLNEKYGLGLTTEQMRERVSRFGADCAFFIHPRPHFATGIGDVLTPQPHLALKGCWLVLVKPLGEFVSTKEAYAGIRPRPARCDLRRALLQPMETWRHTVANDFEETVFASHPRLAAIKKTLYDCGADFALMSGSGATVFALFRHRPEWSAERVFEGCFTHLAQFPA